MPFLCVLNTGTTHEQHICQRDGGPVQPREVRVPKFRPDTPDIRADYAEYYNIMERMNREIGNWMN